MEDAVEDLSAGATGLVAAVGEAVPDRAAGALDAHEQAASDHPGGEGAHRLVGLEREQREVVQRRLRLACRCRSTSHWTSERPRREPDVRGRWWRHCRRFTASPTSWSDAMRTPYGGRKILIRVRLGKDA